MIKVSKCNAQLIQSLPLFYNGLAIYLRILVVVSLLLVGIRIVFADSLVIYAHKGQPDFMQVFFPIGGAYSEEGSVRSTLSDNSINPEKIFFVFKDFDRIRIDPRNDEGEILILKIELKSLFGTETYMPIDLAARAKPIQMIDKFEVTPGGFFIRSTGNDPAFELKIQSPSVPIQIATIFIVSIIFSFALFFLHNKLMLKNLYNVKCEIYILLIPLFVSLGIAALFYPGFMSYDTLHALRGARNGVIDSMWPPMVSYVWRVVDLVSFNPSAMHFSQVFLLLFAIFFIVFFFSRNIKYAALFLLIYLSIPVVLGTIAVIWKDVLMAAFFLAGFAVILSMTLIVNKWWFILSSLVAAFLIFFGVCSRHNAITGAVPLIFYLAFVVCSRLLKTTFRLLLGVLLLGSMLTGAVFVTKSFLDNYSFPDFKKLPNSSGDFIQTVRALDVAGASLCVGSNLFSDVAPNLSLAEISSGYDPRHINLSKGLLDRLDLKKGVGIDKIWLSVAANHPICFLSNKFELTKSMVGADNGKQFLITAPAIDKNEYGYSLPESSLRGLAVNYIVHGSQFLFFKPWFLYLISILSFAYLLRVRALTAGSLTIFSSAVFYLSGLVAFGNAADARLLFYTTTALLVFIFISILEFKTRHK